MLSVNIDLSALTNLANWGEVQRIGDKAAADLALLTQAKVNELAGEKLHSRLQMFREGLSLKQDEGCWVIHLDDKLNWIDEGYPAHSMIPDFINSPNAKTAADGSRYMIVPFAHKSGSSGATQTTAYQQDLVQAIKTQMKKDKIPWGKIEKDDQGRPKLGRLHNIKIQTPNKTHEGPGMGHGEIGQPRVGTTGIPFLHGASVFQSQGTNGKVDRGVVTFRVASEKHMGSDKWEHPGLHATNILNSAYEWALREVQEHVMPDIIKQISALGQ